MQVQDVNALSLEAEQYDVAICVSGLHHVVELEKVIGAINKSLATNGEFWSIGETLGRNGGRLYPQALDAGNVFFGALDEKYRHNRTTGKIDPVLLDLDHSIGCFEGIRCEAIERTLNRYLQPKHVAKHNCLIWKLFSPTYSDNYDMSKERDRALVDEAVEMDAILHEQHSLGVELNAVYAKR